MNGPDAAQWPGVLVGVALAGQLAWGAWLAHRRPEERRTIGFVFGWSVLGLGALAAWLPPAEIPVRWVTLLHEGGTELAFNSLAGRNTHAGPLSHALPALLSPEGGLGGLRALVWANLAATVLGAGILVAMCSRVARNRAVGVLLTAAWLAHPSVRNAAFSETAGPLAVAATLAALGTLSMLPQPASRGGGHRLTNGGGLALAALWTMGAGLARPEAMILGGSALAASALRVAVPPSFWRGLRRRVLRWLREDLRDSRRARWAVALLLLAGLPMELGSGCFDLSVEQRAGLIGLSGAWPTFLDWGTWLAMTSGWLLLGLAAVGGLRALSRPLGALLLAPAAIVLVRVYLTAAHGTFFEVQRYSVTLMPLVALAGALGWSMAASQLRRRGWLPAWRGPILLGLLALGSSQLVPAGGGAPGGRMFDVPSGEERGAALQDRVLLGFDVQREGRFLAAAIDEAPGECALVTRVPAKWHARARGEPTHLLVFDPRRRRVASPRPLANTPRAAVDAVAPQAPCARYVYGLDCNLRSMTACEQDLVGARLVREERFDRAQYNDVDEYGATRGTVRLGLYALE